MRQGTQLHPWLDFADRKEDDLSRGKKLVYRLRLAAHQAAQGCRGAAFGTCLKYLPEEDESYGHRGSFEVKMMKGVLRRSPEEVFPEENETVDEGDRGTEHHQ